MSDGAILFSGGMDSVILAIIARSRGHNLIPFFMSHRANVGNVTKKELRAASELAKATTGNNLIIIKPFTKTTPKWYSDFGDVHESDLLPVVKGNKDRRNRVFIDVLDEFGQADGIVALGLFGSTRVDGKERTKERADDIIPSRLSKYLKSIGSKGTILSLAEYAGAGGEAGGKTRALKDLPASAKKHVLASESCLMWFGKPCGDCWSCMDRVKSITAAWGKDTTPYRAGSKADKHKKGGKGRGSRGRGARRPTMPASAVRAARAGFWRMRLRAGDEDREVVVLKSDIVAALKGVPAGARLYAEPIRARDLRDGTTYTRGIRLGRGSRPTMREQRYTVFVELADGQVVPVGVVQPQTFGTVNMNLRVTPGALMPPPGSAGWRKQSRGMPFSWLAPIDADETEIAAWLAFGWGLEGWNYAPTGGGRGNAPSCPLVDIVEFYDEDTGDIVTEVRPRTGGRGAKGDNPFMDWCAAADAEDAAAAAKKKRSKPPKRARSQKDEWEVGPALPSASLPTFRRGDLVTYGRTRGEKTIGEVVGGIGTKRLHIQQLERRRAHPIGSVWRVAPSLVAPYSGPRPRTRPVRVFPDPPPRRRRSFYRADPGPRVWTHDLQALLAVEKKRFGKGECDDASIRWSRASRRVQGQTLTMGAWNEKRRDIRIHPALDRPEVPAFVMRHLIFHELLHGVIKPYKGSKGRRVIHGPHFKRAERTHPDYEQATEWTKKYLGCLIGTKDWSEVE